MIVLSTPTFDLNGFLIIPNSKTSNIFAVSRRVSRSKTQDGGASISDLGYSDADRTFTISSKHATRALYESAAYLAKTYPLLVISTVEGIFLGAVSGVSLRAGTLNLTYLVKEKLNED